MMRSKNIYCWIYNFLDNCVRVHSKENHHKYCGNNVVIRELDLIHNGSWLGKWGSGSENSRIIEGVLNLSILSPGLSEEFGMCKEIRKRKVHQQNQIKSQQKRLYLSLWEAKLFLLCRSYLCWSLAKHLVVHRSLSFLKMGRLVEYKVRKHEFKWDPMSISVIVDPASKSNDLPSVMLLFHFCLSNSVEVSFLGNLNWNHKAKLISGTFPASQIDIVQSIKTSA